jgi:hypothetical protein
VFLQGRGFELELESISYMEVVIFLVELESERHMDEQSRISFDQNMDNISPLEYPRVNTDILFRVTTPFHDVL